LSTAKLKRNEHAMAREVRDSALDLFDSLSRRGATPDTTLAFSDESVLGKPGVDQPEFATFMVAQGGAIRQVDTKRDVGRCQEGPGIRKSRWRPEKG
jgi:hypothetical protein